MPIQAVIFDIGGVLEHTPSTGWPQRWAARLGIDPAELESVADEIWKPGEIGETSLEQILTDTAGAFKRSRQRPSRPCSDIWDEYLGAANAMPQATATTTFPLAWPCSR